MNNNISMGELAAKINNKILIERQSGQSVATLAKKYGVSRVMIGNRIKKAESNFLDRPFGNCFSIRTFNCLEKAGFTSEAEVLNKFREDKGYFKKLRNFGKKSFLELETFCGESPRTYIAEIRKHLNSVSELLNQLGRLS